MPALTSYKLSDIGRKRTNNEDYAGFLEPSNPQVLKESGALYVVADGLGGHEFGERASQYAVRMLLNEYYRSSPAEPPAERLSRIIQQINRDLYHQAQRSLGPGQKMATTVVAAVVRKGLLQIAHVGDSRAYLIRQGEAKQLTQDHSIVGEMVRAGAITEEQAQQSKYRNRLSRSVGGAAEVKVDLSAPIPLQTGDMLVLCTDGLTQYVTGREIAAICAEGGTPQEIARRLVGLANQRGGSDNITVSVTHYKEKLPAAFASAVRWAALGALTVLLVGALILFGWALGSGRLLPSPTATLTPSPTATLTPFPTATLTATPAPSATATLSPEPSATPTLEVTPSPGSVAPPLLIVCQYTVRKGDMVQEIAARFRIGIADVFRADWTQENMNVIKPGETLLLRGVRAEICLQGGGLVSSPASTPAVTLTFSPPPVLSVTASPQATP